jgi:hypothetical protein
MLQVPMNKLHIIWYPSFGKRIWYPYHFSKDNREEEMPINLARLYSVKLTVERLLCRKAELWT